jgi:Fe-S cluster assembly protein SufD
MQAKLTKCLLIDKTNTTINISNKNAKKLDYFIIDVDEKNTNLKINITSFENQIINVYTYFIATHVNKILKTNIDSKSNSIININIKAFVNHHANIDINLVANATKGSTNIVTNQTIDGVVFDNDSNIKVTPSLIVDTNSIKATHAVNIGNINPEQLFYLMSRRMSKNNATKLIIEGMFDDLHNINLSENNIYNYVIRALSNTLKTYEKH